MLIYPPKTRGSYGRDVRKVKWLIHKLLESQHNLNTNNSVAWGCDDNYIYRNRIDYFVAQLDEVTEPGNKPRHGRPYDRPYSNYRSDVWFINTYHYRNPRTFHDRRTLTEEGDTWYQDLSYPDKKEFYTIKLGSRYQWRFQGTDYCPNSDDWDDYIDDDL